MALTRPVVYRDLLHAFKASYAAVMPQNIVNQHIKYDKDIDMLRISANNIPLSNRKLYLVGAGKGVQFLAREIDSMFGSRIEKGIVSIPEGSMDPTTKSNKIEYFEGAKNNLPDKKAQSTAKLIMELAKSLTSNDILMVLITGGGSALLPLPIEPITLDEKTKLIKQLANAGADITELNVVRKRLSDIKGGKLAECTAAKIITLIISDIVDDPFDLIASGPTVKNNDDPQMAVDILKKYELYEILPKSIKGVLEKKSDKIHNTSLINYQNIVAVSKMSINKNDSEALGNEGILKAQVLNFILASNRMSVHSAKEHFSMLNVNFNNDFYIPIIISRSVTGNVKDVAREYYALSKLFGNYSIGKLKYNDLIAKVHKLNIQGINLEDIPKKLETNEPRAICLILAGETTVEVKGSGIGGRNQQLALEFSALLHKHKADAGEQPILMLSAGTDGIDGPTDAAGAMADTNLVSESEKAGLDIKEYLKNNDSYTFYKQYKDGEYHIKTGHTNTNVMDIHLIVIQKD